MDNFCIEKQKTDAAGLTKRLTAEDFQIYAPKAQLTADIYSQGVATKPAIERLTVAPLASEEPKTKQAMESLRCHYDFLASMSDRVEVSRSSGGGVGAADSVTYKRGITPAAIDKISTVLNGKAAPSYEQFTSLNRDARDVVGFVASIPGMVGGVFAVAGPEVGFGLMAAAGITGGLALGAVGAYAAYKIGDYYDKKNFQEEGRKQYSAFFADLDGTVKIREGLDKVIVPQVERRSHMPLLF